MKKFAAALAALLVLSCGTTFLAAPSVSSPEAAEKLELGIDLDDEEGDETHNG